MHYQEFHPARTLAPYVCSYWSFTVDDVDEVRHYVVPDGCISVVYCSRSAGGESWLRIVGPRLDALQVPVFSGELFWGIRFRPGAAGAVLHLRPPELRDRTDPLADIGPGPGADLCRRLAAAGESADVARVFDEWLLHLVPEADEPDAEVAAAVRTLVSTRGQERIAAVAAEVGLSHRQLQRRFREAVGLTPKEFARVQRVRAAAYGRLLSPDEGWAGLATEAGYTDQPHLCHEFRELVGLTPRSYDHWLGLIRVTPHAPQP